MNQINTRDVDVYLYKGCRYVDIYMYITFLASQVKVRRLIEVHVRRLIYIDMCVDI